MSFISVADLFSGHNIYVMPTFQRPYSWEDRQWNDMKSDICLAAIKASPYHYFAPVHVIEINSSSDSYWINYTDNNNPDIDNLSKSVFRDEYGNALKVYLVVDGQQRISTLYSLIFNSTPTNPAHFINLPGSYKIPRVILNPKNDHLILRHHLGLSSAGEFIPPINSHSQQKINDLFKFLGSSITPLFSSGSNEYKFITSSQCQLLKVVLNARAQLTSFTTLNDRGKDLTILEKSKSLLMGVDENYPPSSGSAPHSINNMYSIAYSSIEATKAYFNDDDFLKQVAMALWEGGNNQIHAENSEKIYDTRFKKIVDGNYVHCAVLPAIEKVAAEHDNLVINTLNATATPIVNLGISSFTFALGVTKHPRDAIEDYFNILKSLKLQSKQLGFLMAVRHKFKCDLHVALGSYKINNIDIKKALRSDFSIFNAMVADLDNKQLIAIANQIMDEIDSIPDEVERELTPLQIAELLRLEVGESKPGTFTSTWSSTFNSSCTKQSCVEQWMNYILSWNGRFNFITDIARTHNAHNNFEWVKYLLKEYEFCLSGINAHRNNPTLDIEHFFGTWDSVSAMVQSTIFSDSDQYNQHFRERIGNKLVLNSNLNRSIHPFPPALKVSVNYLNVLASASAGEVAADLKSVVNLAVYRLYILLRSLRLAAFAAKRF